MQDTITTYIEYLAMMPTPSIHIEWFILIDMVRKWPPVVMIVRVVGTEVVLVLVAVNH